MTINLNGLVSVNVNTDQDTLFEAIRQVNTSPEAVEYYSQAHTDPADQADLIASQHRIMGLTDEALSIALFEAIGSNSWLFATKRPSEDGVIVMGLLYLEAARRQMANIINGGN